MNRLCCKLAQVVYVRWSEMVNFGDQ